MITLTNSLKYRLYVFYVGRIFSMAFPAIFAGTSLLKLNRYVLLTDSLQLTRNENLL